MKQHPFNHVRQSVLALLLAAAALPLQAQMKKGQQMEQRARALIEQMTADEKISQLMNDAPGIDRLGLKPYNWWSEALHGVGRTGRATVFPEPIGLGATFDPALVQAIGDAVSTEARAKFNVAQRMHNYSQYAGLTFWAPNVNIFRDPRWGRGMETYGEDPLLTGTLGVAYVHGMQGTDPFYLKTAACGKHFAVHSGPESTRHEANVNPSRRDLYATYLPAFRMLVQEGRVETIMGAYNALYGESCSGSRLLLTDILRGEWGFRGHIVSDCGAVDDIYKGHKIAKNAAEAAAIAIKSGLNLECGQTFKALRQVLDQGLITEKDLDHALLPLMMTRLRLGIVFDDPDCPFNTFGEEVIGQQSHIDLARRAAQESMVLLKNDRQTLPLAKDIQTLYVVGPAATDVFYQMGNYYGVSNHYSTYLQGIVDKVSAGTSINYKQGFMPLTNNLNTIDWSTGEARQADVCVLFLGNNGNTEGEEGDAIASDQTGDRHSLALPASQMEYFRKIADGHKNRLVVVLTGGSPIDVREIAEKADAVVMAWYSGQEGGMALGDLLFGDADFTGRLPITFPLDDALLPPFDDYSMQGRTYRYTDANVLFPFGYGLSYAHVEYSDLTVGKPLKNKDIQATVRLTNTSSRNVTEVLQAYVTTPAAEKGGELRQLALFQRIDLRAGESRVVSCTIPADRLKTIQNDGTAKLLKGTYTLSIGAASPGPRTEQLGVSIATTQFKL